MKFDRLKRERFFHGFASVIRLGLGCLFLWSSLPKIRQPYDFLSNVYEYELVGAKLGMLTAMVLPWLELLLGICLLGGICAGDALLASTTLAAVFVFAQASALYRGLEISCGCFSTSGSGFVNYATLIRTCLILLAAVTGYMCLLIFQGKKVSANE